MPRRPLSLPVCPPLPFRHRALGFRTVAEITLDVEGDAGTVLAGIEEIARTDTLRLQVRTRSACSAEHTCRWKSRTSQQRLVAETRALRQAI